MGDGAAQITVVVVVYNAETSVEKCLNSLKGQDTHNFHLLVVDDGSTDGSVEVCRKLLRHIPVPAAVACLPHGGVAKARNYGLQQVKTEYVLFLDCDDWLEADTISKLLSLVNARHPELIVFGFCYETAGERSYAVRAAHQRELFSREAILKQFVGLWSSGLMYSSCNKLFQVALLREHTIEFADLDFGEDFAFCRDVLRVCQKLFMSDCCFYHYTCHVKGSLSTAYRSDLFQIRVWEHCRFVEYFRQLGCLDPCAEEFLARRHIERVIGCIENECSPESSMPMRQRFAHIKAMLDEEHTISCAKIARINSLPMKLLVIPVQRKWYRLAMLSGYVMTICRNRLPGLFAWLKMSR